MSSPPSPSPLPPQDDLPIKSEDNTQNETEIQIGPPTSQPSQSTQTLAILLIATAGQNGNLLGSDEEEIVLVQMCILDCCRNEVLSTATHFVKPSTSDLNETILSEECREEFHISDEDVKNGRSLEFVLGEVDSLLSKCGDSSTTTILVPDQLTLRQCLHPEASAKDLVLNHWFDSFYDLGKEYGRVYGNGDEGVEEVDIEQMYKALNLPPLLEPTTQTKLNQMTSVVQSMIKKGHEFKNPDIIQMKLEPGICSRSDPIDGACIVRARGLPWQSSDQDIAKFFRGLNIAKGGVALCLSPQGRRNGEALIRFESELHREMALKRHKHHIGTRYIEVYKATGEDFLAVAGGTNNEAQAFLTKGAAVIVRMRGLPYDCTAKQVLDFFSTTGETPCQVLDAEEGVLFVRRPDGRATGDAFVLFKLEEDSSKALSKHRESIGSRYIELFRSTTAEVQQVLNRCLEQQSKQSDQQLSPVLSPQQQLSPVVPPAVLQQHMITAGTRKDCIRLRGLPYEAQVEHILEFLGEHAKSIVFQGVHMVYNSQGQPSGEAFIQMDSESSAYIAAQSKHHRYMIYFKKQRYIEVFQCSGEDMSCVLTGGVPVGPGGQQQNQQQNLNQKFITSAGMSSQNLVGFGGGPVGGVAPMGPLSPSSFEQFSPLLRGGAHPTALAAALASLQSRQQPQQILPPGGGLFSPLSLAGFLPMAHSMPGIPIGGSLLGSPPSYQGLMGSPPLNLKDEFCGFNFQRNLPVNFGGHPQNLLNFSPQSIILNNLLTHADRATSTANKRNFEEAFSYEIQQSAQGSPAKRGVAPLAQAQPWWPQGGATGGPNLNLNPNSGFYKGETDQ